MKKKKPLLQDSQGIARHPTSNVLFSLQQVSVISDAQRLQLGLELCTFNYSVNFMLYR